MFLVSNRLTQRKKTSNKAAKIVKLNILKHYSDLDWGAEKFTKISKICYNNLSIINQHKCCISKPTFIIESTHRGRLRDLDPLMHVLN